MHLEFATSLTFSFQVWGQGWNHHALASLVRRSPNRCSRSSVLPIVCCSAAPPLRSPQTVAGRTAPRLFAAGPAPRLPPPGSARAPALAPAAAACLLAGPALLRRRFGFLLSGSLGSLLSSHLLFFLPQLCLKSDVVKKGPHLLWPPEPHDAHTGFLQPGSDVVHGNVAVGSCEQGRGFQRLCHQAQHLHGDVGLARAGWPLDDSARPHEGVQNCGSLGLVEIFQGADLFIDLLQDLHVL
mmetsp:Transcript_47528/g.119794  ORF Transcript_47528/g.119794 Transcript_47528/m.119794 type:complete len:240 (-) Transcript_47528:471-1190(-)